MNVVIKTFLKRLSLLCMSTDQLYEFGPLTSNITGQWFGLYFTQAKLLGSERRPGF